MVATLAGLHRQTALLQAQVRTIAEQRTSRPPAWASPVDLAADLGIVLDDWQARTLSTDARDILVVASRQAGKSTVGALLALHQSVAVPGSTTLIVSPTERQSKLLLRTVRRHYQTIRDAAPAGVEGTLSIEWRNGSAVYALPGSEHTIRGFSAVDLLVLDEGARIPDELYHAISPMRAISNGRLIGLSTPFGQRGWLFNEWDAGGDAWHRELVPAELCPRIAPAFLTRERERLGAHWYQQEFECVFAEGDDALFMLDDITAALDTDLDPLFAGRIFA